MLLGTKPVVCWGGSRKDSPLPGVSAGAFLADSPQGARCVPPQGASVSPGGMWHGEAGPQSSRWGRRGEICFVQSPTSVQGPDKGAELLTAAPRGAQPCPSSVPAGHQGSFWHVPSPRRLHKAQEGMPPPPHVLSPVLGHVCVAQSISFALCSILSPMERVQVK